MKILKTEELRFLLIQLSVCNTFGAASIVLSKVTDYIIKQASSVVISSSSSSSSTIIIIIIITSYQNASLLLLLLLLLQLTQNLKSSSHSTSTHLMDLPARPSMSGMLSTRSNNRTRVPEERIEPLSATTTKEHATNR